MILEPIANVPPLIFHAVPLGSCFPQSLSVASIAFAFSLFSPRYNPFLKEKGLPYAYGKRWRRQTVGNPMHLLA